MAAILQAFMNGKWVEIPALQGGVGFSPTVTVADEGDTITITVEDKNGKKTISYAKGSGDMLKSVYDTDGDGVVDQAESATKAADADKLGDELPSAYRKKADLIDFKTEITNKPTMESFQVNFPASGWALDSGDGVYAQTAAADLNPDTDEIVVDINLNNEYKDELREAWAELRDFAIVQGGLTGHFFEQPTVDMTVNVLRYRKA